MLRDCEWWGVRGKESYHCGRVGMMPVLCCFFSIYSVRGTSLGEEWNLKGLPPCSQRAMSTNIKMSLERWEEELSHFSYFLLFFSVSLSLSAAMSMSIQFNSRGFIELYWLFMGNMC